VARRLRPPRAAGTGTENRRTWRLAQILEVPIAQALGMVPEKLVWHCVVRAADADRSLAAGEW
jgi:hypothetical protein